MTLKFVSTGARMTWQFETIAACGIALATYEYAEARAGDRICSLGEAPYLDLNSKSMPEALGL